MPRPRALTSEQEAAIVASSDSVQVLAALVNLMQTGAGVGAR